MKDSTIGAYRRKLSAFFGWLARNGHVERNPIDGLPHLVPRYENVKMLRKAQIERIRAAIETSSQSLLQLKRDRAIVAVLLFCGLRRGELLGLKVTDVDMERRILVVRSEATKSKLPRKLPLNDQISLILEDYLAERNKNRRYTTPSLFVSMTRDGGLSVDGIVHWVIRLRRAAGVEFHLHQFRHTFASNLAAQGINSVLLQKLMGHSDLRMLQAYVRSLDAEDLRPALSTLGFDNLA
ncbi:MAG TPA: site-specific integrase [Verrucomicrobiae bacterium]|nr:site-specific integrase [Verrucomicrobiae bacterium]